MTTTTAADAPSRTSRRRGPGFLAPLLLGIALGGSLALLGVGVAIALDGGGRLVFCAGAVATAVVLSAAALASVLVRDGAGRAADGIAERVEAAVTPLREEVRRATERLGEVADHTKISDRAKRVAYRDGDREAVRRAVEEDLVRGDYASARLLADEFEKSFGYKREAEGFREEIRRRVEGARTHEIDDARHKIDRLCDAEQWPAANAEADRLITKYGGDMQVRLLRTRVEERRQQRKVELVERFHDLHNTGDAEGAADVLKQLDAYLTPGEGRELENEAREVFRVRLLRLKDRYTAAMREHDYEEALRVGGLIRRDYPNSQLAKEAEQAEPRLREAAGMGPAEEG